MGILFLGGPAIEVIVLWGLDWSLPIYGNCRMLGLLWAPPQVETHDVGQFQHLSPVLEAQV